MTDEGVVVIDEVCSIAGCGAPSLPGLTTGAGKCNFHWAEGVWGRTWALKCYANRRRNARPDERTRTCDGPNGVEK
jgi:hypothetical protein